MRGYCYKRVVLHCLLDMNLFPVIKRVITKKTLSACKAYLQVLMHIAYYLNHNYFHRQLCNYHQDKFLTMPIVRCLVETHQPEMCIIQITMKFKKDKIRTDKVPHPDTLHIACPGI